jgi:predicted N-acetyltransferase YhbS
MARDSKAQGKTERPLTIRRATPADAEACGRICFEAFRSVAEEHNFPWDVPDPEAGVRLLSMLFAHPGFYCVVADQDGKIIGSNCLDERNSISGVGPITVDPAAQNRSAGRELMRAVMDRSAERRFAGIRLVQSAYHNRSLSLYAKLGFVAREPLSCMQGPPIEKAIPRHQVRPAERADLAACNDLCRRVHGHDRSAELADAMAQGTAMVAVLDGRIAGYASATAFFGHAAGESNQAVEAIIAQAKSFNGPGLLIPTRNAELFRWCLENGLRVVQPMTLMTMGLYNEPSGSYLPSILF